MSTEHIPTREATGRVWLITGASSGFGRAIAEAALAAGDTVVATARRPEALDDLVAAHPDRAVALRLDVTDPAADRRRRRRGRRSGTAGSTSWSTTPAAAMVGAVEETTDARTARPDGAALLRARRARPAPCCRTCARRGSGAIVQMSSMGGRMSVPGCRRLLGDQVRPGRAVRGARRARSRPLGIKVLIVEPGAFRTGFAGGALRQSAADRRLRGRRWAPSGP